MFRGVLQNSIEALIENLKNDPVIIENKAKVLYRLEHPAKQITTAGDTFQIYVEPSGWSQLAGAGALDLQYFFWLFIKCKPSAFGVTNTERLTGLMEYLSEKIHGAKWGQLNAFLTRSIINYRTVTLKTNNRDVYFELKKDEIGATMMFWASMKTQEELQEEELGGE